MVRASRRFPEDTSSSMTPSRVRRSSSHLVAFAVVLAAMPFAASAQERAPLLWFQATRLILDRPVAQAGDIAVSTRDSGLRRFLEKLGATVAFEPQSRYVVVTAQDRRTIAFTLGDPWYTVAGVRVRAPFAPSNDGGDRALPVFALARALYVAPVQDG